MMQFKLNQFRCLSIFDVFVAFIFQNQNILCCLLFSLFIYFFSFLNLQNSGTVLHSKSTPNSRDFGEGITVFNGKIYQLTWQNKR